MALLVMQSHNNMNMNSYEYYMEKRQLFLRSYQFSRKKSLTERMKGSLFRVKRVIWVRLKSARKIRKLVRWGRRRFVRLINHNTNYYYQYHHYNNSSSLW